MFDFGGKVYWWQPMSWGNALFFEENKETGHIRERDWLYQTKLWTQGVFDYIPWIVALIGVYIISMIYKNFK